MPISEMQELRLRSPCDLSWITELTRGGVTHLNSKFLTSLSGLSSKPSLFIIILHRSRDADIIPGIM